MQFQVRVLVLTIFALACVGALYLGLADLSLPHDKVIHFSTFFILSTLFYWLFKTRYRYFASISTFIICTICGSVVSEFLQHWVSPYRTFDKHDIIANLCGSFAAIIVSELYRYFLHIDEQNTYYELVPLNDIIV